MDMDKLSERGCNTDKWRKDSIINSVETTGYPCGIKKKT